MSGKSVEFETVLLMEDGGVGIEVPQAALAALGYRGSRPPVLVTMNGFTYRSTVAVYAGKSYLPVRREVQEKAGVAGGHRVTVRLDLDQSPRTVDLPADLARALAEDRAARQAFEKLSYTNQKEAAGWIEGARRPETRARRLAETLRKLGA